MIVLLCATGGSAIFVLEQVQSLSDALRQNPSLKVGSGVLAQAAYGGPETLLLVGDDTRRGFKYYHGFVPDLANEMLLVRLDPSAQYITMMSIPRELQAQVYSATGRPLYINRLNSAYLKGIGALVTTIKLDYGISIDHVLVATFGSFERAVNEMGCVYSTVDQRYYHVNVPGGPQYQEINLQPGYQKLCGSQAEQFVSYRHTDTSLVRDARDQSFLLDVKKQFGPTLFNNASKFERIFGKAVITDASLKSNTQILSLLATLINLSSRSVRDVHFQVDLQPTYDTATPQQIHYSVYEFLHGGLGPPKNSVAAQARAVHSKRGVAHLPLVPTPSSAMAQARAAAAKTPFPLEYPQVEDRGGSSQAPDLRTYNISGPGGVAYPAYVGVFDDGGLGNYYDVQGTTWWTAPQFDSPDQTVQVGDRTYYLFYESANLRMVAWYEHGAVYWVRNSLTNSVPNGEMLAIAEQTQPFTVAGAGPRHPKLILQAVRVNVPPKPKPKIPLRELLGGIGALATLICLPLLMFLGIRRFMDLRKARAMLTNGGEIGERLPLGPPLPPAARPSPVPLLATGSAFGEVGLPLLPRRSSSGIWTGNPRVYRRSDLHRRALIVSLLAVLVLLAGGAAAAVLLTRHSAPSSPVHRVKHVVRPLVPTVPVAVLNATSTAGAASKLANSLKADHIKVSTVGNLQEAVPPGNEILYLPGQRAQARLLAHLLRGQVATVAPVDPVAAAAAGAGAELVVVITS